MNRPRVRRLVTVFGAITTVGVLGVVVACGGGERPDSETDTPITRFDGGNVTSGGVTIDVDDKGVLFGDNGLVNCGAQAPDKVVTLKNTTSDIVNFTARLSVGDNFYTLAPAAGAIQAGATATVTVSAKPIPAESDVANDLYAGTLEVKVANQQPVSIRLHQTARGAIINPSVVAASLTLPTVKVGESSTVPLALTNAGNAEATASLQVGTAFYSIDGSALASQKLVPGDTKTSTIKFAPTSPGDLADSLIISYNSGAVFCKEPPKSIALTGKGTTSVGISAAALDFGLVNCSTTAAPQTVTISSTVAMTFTAVLTKGGLSPYTLANDADSSVVNAADNVPVPAASSFKLRVVPKGIPAVSATADNGFGDTLTITTNVTGDTPHAISLRETAQGAILSFDPNSAVSLQGAVGGLVNYNFGLRNTGNVIVPYKITASPAPSGTAGGFESTLTTGNAIIGNTAGILKATAATAKGTITNGSLKVELGAAGGVLCADLPPTLPLAITATGSAITLNPLNLNYGIVNCGDSAPPAQSFTLSATVDNNIKLSLGKGPSSYFSLANDAAGASPIANNTNVNVKPGTPKVVYVIPKKIELPASISAPGQPSFYDDALELTSDIPTEDVRSIPLRMSAFGAFFNLPGSVVEGAGIAIANTGGASAKLTVSGPVTPNGDVTVASGATLNLATTGSGSVTVTPKPGSGACVATGTVTVTPKM